MFFTEHDYKVSTSFIKESKRSFTHDQISWYNDLIQNNYSNVIF